MVTKGMIFLENADTTKKRFRFFSIQGASKKEVARLAGSFLAKIGAGGRPHGFCIVRGLSKSEPPSPYCYGSGMINLYALLLEHRERIEQLYAALYGGSK